MRFIKRVLYYLALLLAGGFFGYGVTAMCALLIQKICAGAATVHRLSLAPLVPLVLLLGALLLAALDEVER